MLQHALADSGNVFVGLFTSDPSVNLNGAVEFDGGVSRVQVTMTATANPKKWATTAQVAMPRYVDTGNPTITATHCAFFDAATGGNMKFSSALDVPAEFEGTPGYDGSKVIQLDDVVYFPAGYLYVEL